LFWTVLIALVVQWPEGMPGEIRATIWFGPLLVGEPLEIRLFGHTFGQRFVGLRVVSRSGSPIGFPRLLARHLSKGVFLGTSLFYTLFSPRGQALHDHLFGTDVVSLRGGAPQGGGPVLRHPIRAFLVSLVFGLLAGWLISILVGVAILIALGVTGRGVPRGFEEEAVFNMLLGVAFTYGCFRVLFRGAAGRLPGTGGSRTRMPESGGDGQLRGCTMAALLEL
jgi:uncharacterized RDD family membrane protein YckC